jgi:hypothetical protein
MSPEHLEVPESKKGFKSIDGAMSNEHESQLMEPQWPKMEQPEQQNNMVLDYNPQMYP